MLEKMSDNEKNEYLSSLESLKEQQLKRREAIENGKKIRSEYDSKLQNMKESNKKMLLLFTMQGCPACTVLKYITKYNSDVNQILDKVEFITIDGATTQIDLTTKYNIYSYPYYIILDKEENIVAKNMGCNGLADPAAEFASWLKSFV